MSLENLYVPEIGEVYTQKNDGGVSVGHGSQPTESQWQKLEKFEGKKKKTKVALDSSPRCKTKICKSKLI